ncbi:MAG TPA: hypothetical protein VN375_04890 [Vicinamibacteria bacterium]|nr:hypothetical protein [Vicinamibacteria bacterium]
MYQPPKGSLSFFTECSYNTGVELQAGPGRPRSQLWLVSSKFDGSAFRQVGRHARLDRGGIVRRQSPLRNRVRKTSSNDKEEMVSRFPQTFDGSPFVHVDCRGSFFSNSVDTETESVTPELELSGLGLGYGDHGRVDPRSGNGNCEAPTGE